MITPATLGAIVVCAPEGAPRRAARQLLEILCSCASVAEQPDERNAPRARTVFRALDCIDDLEDLAKRRMGGRVPLRGWRACLLLRALVARGRPVMHDRVSHFLCDDETGDGFDWWEVGPRREANDNERAGKERRSAP